jgi:hypothetical protein
MTPSQINLNSCDGAGLLTRATGSSLLFKGDDFALTDMVSQPAPQHP